MTNHTHKKPENADGTILAGAATGASKMQGSIPTTNDTISVSSGRDFQIFAPAERITLQDGKDAYVAKAVMLQGGVFNGCNYIAFEIYWNIPADGVDGIDWNQPDAIMPTATVLDVNRKYSYAGIKPVSTDTGTYIRLTDAFLSTAVDRQGLERVVYEAEGIRENDVPDENGVLPVYAFRWQIPANDVYKPEYRLADRRNDVSETPDEIELSKDYIYLVKDGRMYGIRSDDSYGGDDPLTYTFQMVKESAQLMLDEPTEDNPSGLYIIDLQALTGLSADMTWAAIHRLTEEIQKEQQ